MNDIDQTGLEKDCRELSGAFQGVLSWKWDSRLEAILAEFDVDRKDNIRAILERHLSIRWDSFNIGGAPEPVRKIISHLGELRSGQLLFTSHAKRGALIFCAWWPWGDGQTVSIRIAPSYENVLDPEKAKKIQIFKGWFGI